MEKCKGCRNAGCPKCGTTHGMWECIAHSNEKNNPNIVADNKNWVFWDEPGKEKYMKYDVHGSATVVVTVTVEAENGEEAIEKAQEAFGGLHSYCGNGGVDKLIGVGGSNESIELAGEPEFDDYTEN